MFARPPPNMSFKAGDPPGSGRRTAVDGPYLLVLGNPGVGKTVLSFLFIRVLLELGTKVYRVLHSYSFFFFQVIEYKNGRKKVSFKITREGNMVSFSNEFGASVNVEWKPSALFLPASLHPIFCRYFAFGEYCMVLDEFCFPFPSFFFFLIFTFVLGVIFGKRAKHLLFYSPRPTRADGIIW
jgi:hypothetical protein